MINTSITVHVRVTACVNRTKSLILHTYRYNGTRPKIEELKTILDKVRNDNQHIMPESIYLECVERFDIM